MVLRAGLIGLGMMGRNHARVMSSTDQVTLVGIADPIGDPAGNIDHSLLVESVPEFIEIGIDLAVVACPTSEHEQVAMQLCDAGIHTLVEKPLAASTTSARNVAEAFSAAGLVGAVGHIERFNPAIRELRKRVADGQIGNIYQIATRRAGPFPNRIKDVGVIKDLATHDLDLTSWVGGAPYGQVFAHSSFKTGRENEDLVIITGKLNNHILTNHLVNWLSPVKERLVSVTGEFGCLSADTLLADLSFFKNGESSQPWEGISQFRGMSEGDVIRYAIDKPEPLRTEFEGFVKTILGEDGEIVPMSDGLEAVIVAEAALKSSKSGKNENVSLL